MKKVLLLALCVMFAGLANAAIVVEHQGANDPLTEGWTGHRLTDGVGIEVGPIIDDGGYDAWKINDIPDSEGGYLGDISSADLTAGWKLSAEIRLPADNQDRNGTVVFGANMRNYANNGNHRLWLEIGQYDGVPEVAYFGTGSVRLDGFDNGYHLYEIIFDAATSTADLFVDGIEITALADYAGKDEGYGEGYVFFGSDAGGNTGQAYYSSVVFETVPEPMTMALLGMGGLFLRRRRS